MTTLTAIYKGQLRSEASHTRSGTTLITDAPPDNMGKGEAFSPTDLIGAALSTCMMTTMGIWAQREGIDLSGMETEVVKVMASDPRRIAELKVKLIYKQLQASHEQKEKLKSIALNCPVALSLSDSLIQSVTFDF